MYSNLTRLVMVSWLFLVLILNSSYTASLSSMLTVQQLQPNVTSIEWLKKNNMKIGCDGDSFVRAYLQNVEKFKPENIINISSDDNYVSAFQNSTIAAAFLELPYEKVYISKYCKGYSASTPTTRFGGLGFVFQKGSPLARDVSVAMLKLMEQGEMKSLEEKWLNPSGECFKNGNSNSTESLKLESFWVLYVISGGTSTICFLIFTIHYLKSRKSPHDDEAHQGNGESKWKRMVRLTKHVYRMKNNNAVRAHEDVTDCSSRWDSVSTPDTPPELQHAVMALQLPEIITVSSM